MHIGKADFIGDIAGGKPQIRGLISGNNFLDKAALSKVVPTLSKMYDIHVSVGTDGKGAFITF